MSFQRKLFWIDMMLVAAVVTLMFLPPGKWKDGLTGATAAVFVISIVNHVKHFISFKRFY